MLLLVLIALAQLAVLVMILASLGGQPSQRETDDVLASERIRAVQRQTIEAMFTAATDGDLTDGTGHNHQKP